MRNSTVSTRTVVDAGLEIRLVADVVPSTFFGFVAVLHPEKDKAKALQQMDIRINFMFLKKIKWKTIVKREINFSSFEIENM
ncbi:MAG: hypothetical protein K2Y28_06580 [Burkholderiaceae bacterium]|nr:hypothetical protein [Burkholderiaceae bacterium]